jgi:hypothetical protein
MGANKPIEDIEATLLAATKSALLVRLRRSRHPHESELKRRTQSRPGAKPAAQHMSIIAGQCKKATHLESAHLPRKTATPKI